MTDKELLKLAAKAAHGEFANQMIESGWNPLADDGEALRLAVELGIIIWECAQYDRAMAEIRYGKASGEYWEPIENDDPYAATRRAIVKAAAEIGRAMK